MASSKRDSLWPPQNASVPDSVPSKEYRAKLYDSTTRLLEMVTAITFEKSMKQPTCLPSSPYFEGNDQGGPIHPSTSMQDCPQASLADQHYQCISELVRLQKARHKAETFLANMYRGRPIPTPQSELPFSLNTYQLISALNDENHKVGEFICYIRELPGIELPKEFFHAFMSYERAVLCCKIQLQTVDWLSNCQNLHFSDLVEARKALCSMCRCTKNLREMLSDAMQKIIYFLSYAD